MREKSLVANIPIASGGLVRGKGNAAMEHAETAIKDMSANPAPLGLMGFGLTTILLNLHNAGLIQLSSMILAMGICYGGIGQVIVGVMEWKKKNTFGMLAFTSYGLFWLSLVAMLVLPKMSWAAAPDKTSVACYLSLWGLFTLLMFLGTLKTNRALMTVFGSLTVLFALLAAGDFTGNHSITVIAGIEGIFTGLSAVYLGTAQMLNEVHGRTVLPIGPCA
jgi:succinate-acetate transporter protein